MSTQIRSKQLDYLNESRTHCARARNVAARHTAISSLLPMASF